MLRTAASAFAALIVISSPAALAAPAPIADSVAQEPLFAEIVSRASVLKQRVEGYQSSGSLSGFDAFKAEIARLSDLNQRGSTDLRTRGVDGDLACILEGIAVDLTFRLSQLEQAGTVAAREDALDEMFYLLRDNVEVITTPPPAA